MQKLWGITKDNQNCTLQDLHAAQPRQLIAPFASVPWRLKRLMHKYGVYTSMMSERPKVTQHVLRHTIVHFATSEQFIYPWKGRFCTNL